MTVTEAGEGRPVRRRDAVATRRALLAAARTLMAERGVAVVGIREVAAVAGVNQALVYRYFGSKDQLFAEAARDSAADAADVFRCTPLPEVVPALLGSTREERANATIARYLSSADDDNVRGILRDRIQDQFGTVLAARMPGPDAALRAELMAAVVAGIGFLRDKIGTAELVSVDEDRLHDHVRRMVAPLLDPERGGDGAAESD